MKSQRLESPHRPRICRTLLSIGTALVAFGLVCVRPAQRAEAGGPPKPPRKLPLTCISDSVTHDNLSFFNAGPLTGIYHYVQCSTGFMLDGRGTVANQSGVVTLTDREPDRSVNAGLLTSQNTGKASISFMIAPGVFQYFQVNKTDPSTPCGCRD